MCASDALFVSVHTLQKVRDAAADVELSHRLLAERLAASFTGAEKETSTEGSEKRRKRERDALPVTGSVEHLEISSGSQ